MAAYTMGWKVEEPASPLAHIEDDVWFFPEDGDKTNVTEDNNFGSLTRRELAQQLLEDIDSIVKNEEKDTFSDWIEETIDLHMFDEIQPVMPAEEPQSGTDVNTTRDVNEIVNTADLTPPYSPEDACSDSCIILSYAPVEKMDLPVGSILGDSYQPIYGYVLTKGYDVKGTEDLTESLPDQLALCALNRPQPSAQSIPGPATPVPDLEQEMAVVDEVVRKTAQSLGNNIQVWELEISNSQISSSDSLQGYEAGIESDDSEWVPPSMRKCVTSPRKRPKPYERPKSQEDRLLRKKEQNKNAATRYRQKKKAEISEIKRQEKLLEQRRGKLKQHVDDIQTEIRYLKNLMRDLFLDKESSG